MHDKKKKLRWGWIIIYPIVLRIIMILLTFPYMMFYSEFINPGMDSQFYRSYVFENRAWISTIIGLPIFYLACLYMSRSIKADVIRNLLAMVSMYIVMDIPLEFVFGDPSDWRLVIAHISKLLVGYLVALMQIKKTINS